MVGPFLFTLTFAYFISESAPMKLPGAPFLLAAALLVLALVIAWRTLAVTKIVGWAKRKRAHHLSSRSGIGGGHGASAPCPPTS